MNNLLGSYFSFGHLPLGLGNCSDSRPVEDTFISASRARCRPGEGEGWGVEEGGRLLEWIKLRHRTRVIVLKLSFNGRQCQKLSSISPVLVLSRLVFSYFYRWSFPMLSCYSL